MQDLQGRNSTNNNPYNGKSETISELAHRHLTDENHTTSDEEMKNATVELSEDGKVDDGNIPEAESSTVSPKVNEEGNNGEDTKSETPAFPNPYDVIGS